MLQGLQDPDNHARWQQYIDRYRPLIVRFAQRRGSTDQDAEDIAQNSLLEFSKAYLNGNYDREKGRLRSWLFGIVYRQLLNHRREERRRDFAGDLDTEAMASIGNEDELQKQWDQEWEQAVVRQSLSVIRGEFQPQTFLAFEAFALGERPAVEVAAELGLSENAVFSAKRRVLRRLREVLPMMRDIW